MRSLTSKKVRSFKSMLFGNKESSGLLSKLIIYSLLIFVGYVFIYPIIVMFTSSLKDSQDIVNPLVNWVPTHIYLENFIKAWNTLGGTKTVLTTVGIAFAIASLQTISAAVIGYGFAKFNFPFKRILFVLMIITFIIPEQVTFMPRYLIFKTYGMLESIMPFTIPAILGQGIKNTMFVLIFFQFFKMTPKALDEAAEVDGAGFLRVFVKINLPLAIPAVIVVFIFSFVWNWNETYLASLYYGTAITTMPLALQRFTEMFLRMYPNIDASNPLMKLNEGIRMAGTILTIIPLMIAYLFIERKLIESIDSAGITGE